MTLVPDQSNFSANELMTHFRDLFVELKGDGQIPLNRVSAIEECGPQSAVFVDKEDYVKWVEERKPSAVITSTKLKDKFTPSDSMSVLVSKNVPLAHALVKGRFGDRNYARGGWPQVHPTAVIHPTAKVASTAFIEPHVVIAQNVVVGANTRIMAGSVIENDATIGENTVIHPKVVVGYSCRIGNEVNIGSGSVIGSEGFGFAQDEKRKSHPIPQTGIVVVEDRVRIGANTCIDRATYQVTRIGAGTKIDNLCHIAHNVQIGQDCLLTSMFCIAGSSKVGDRVITSGQTGILDHVSVCSDAVLLHRAGVQKDLTEPGVYAGHPLQTLSEYLKNSAILKTLGELRKRIRDLEK